MVPGPVKVVLLLFRILVDADGEERCKREDARIATGQPMLDETIF